MKERCEQCGYILTERDIIRCPRCNQLLLTPCNGNCSSCRSANCNLVKQTAKAIGKQKTS